MLVIEEELRRAGLWEVYQKDVVDLDPILRFMSLEGMPIDADIRAEKAIELDRRLAKVRSTLEGLVPLEARKIEHVYKNPPKDLTGLMVRTVPKTIDVCERCGVERPKKDHFKVFKRKSNPCGAAHTVQRVEDRPEYYRLGDFKPSREQLIRYQQTLNRPVPKTKDKKSGQMRASMDEKAIKGLMLKYPLDPLYSLVLEYRELDKLAGTYIGRPDRPLGRPSE